MKLFFFLISFSLSSCLVHAQSLSVNSDGSTAAASAILDVKSNTKGVLIPRMSKAEKNAIASPANGLMIYQDTPDSIGFYFFQGASWKMIQEVSASQPWLQNGNSGTSAGTDYMGTSDSEDLVFKTNGNEALRIDSIGKVGIGTTTPAHKLQVNGDIRFVGDFINQDAVGNSLTTVQNIPFTNGTFNPLNGASNSITVVDGSGVNNSAVFISGFARVFGGNLSGNSSSVGGYFLILQRDVDPAFPSPTIVTYTSGICFLSTPNGAGSSPIAFGGGGHISFLDTGLAPGTYYYRLTFYTNGVGITSGTYDVYQRSLSILQIKR